MLSTSSHYSIVVRWLAVARRVMGNDSMLSLLSAPLIEVFQHRRYYLQGFLVFLPDCQGTLAVDLHYVKVRHGGRHIIMFCHHSISRSIYARGMYVQGIFSSIFFTFHPQLHVTASHLLPVGFKTCLCLFIQLLLVSLRLCSITVLLCTRLERSYHAIVIMAYSRLRLAFSVRRAACREIESVWQEAKRIQRPIIDILRMCIL